MENMPNEQKKPSVAPLVLGILSFLGLLSPIIGLVLGIIGLVMSSKDKKLPDSKFGKIGFILSIIGIVLSIANWIYGAVIIANALKSK